MDCTRMAPKTHWVNVGYTAAKRGVTFESIRVPGEGKLVNQWILEGMDKWARKLSRRELHLEQERARIYRNRRQA